MMEIWKYPIPIKDTFEIEMPEGSKVLTIQTQHGKPVLWALVPTDFIKKSVKHPFRLVGIDHLVPYNSGEYIGTFQLGGGILVFHLFHGDR